MRPGDPLFLLVSTPPLRERCKFPQPRLSSGGRGIHHAHAATEEGILPRQAGVIRGRASMLPPSPPPRSQPRLRASGAGLGEHITHPRDPLSLGEVTAPRVGTGAALECKAPSGNNEDSLLGDQEGRD